MLRFLAKFLKPMSRTCCHNKLEGAIVYTFSIVIHPDHLCMTIRSSIIVGNHLFGAEHLQHRGVQNSVADRTNRSLVMNHCGK